MSTQPESLDKIWTERELAERLNLPIRKSGRSIPLSFMIRGGLPHSEKSGRRFFFESDIVSYFWSRRKASETAE